MKRTPPKRKRESQITVMEFILAAATSTELDHSVGVLIFGDTYNFRIPFRDMNNAERVVNSVVLPVVRNAEPPVFCSQTKLRSAFGNAMAHSATTEIARWLRTFGEVKNK